MLNETDVAEGPVRVTIGGRGWCFHHIPLISIQAPQEASQLIDGSGATRSVGHQKKERAKICTQQFQGNTDLS